MTDDPASATPSISELTTTEPVEWKRGILFAVCLFRGLTNANKIFELKADTYDGTETKQVNVLEMFLRYRLYRDDLPLKDDETRATVARYYYEATQIQDYTVVHVVAELTVLGMQQLISLHAARIQRPVGAFDIKINNLVAKLLPTNVPGRIDEYSEYRAVRHVLYLEPTNSLYERESSELPDGLVDSLRKQFGYEKIWEKSIEMQDVLIFPGLGYGNRSLSYLAIRPRPLAPDRMMKIPLIPLSFLNHVAACSIKHIHVNGLSQLAITRDDYWQRLASANFENYRVAHLQNRREAENLILKAEEVSAVIESELPRPLIYRDDYTTYWGAADTEVDKELFGRSIGDVTRNDKDRADNRLIDEIRNTKRRLEVFDGFARDAAIASSTATSLRLAKSVGRLTWVVVAVAVLTLGVSVFPDKAKEKFLYRIVGQESSATSHQ